MLNKILCLAILGVFAGLLPAGAQTPPATPSAPSRVKGVIVAARVIGHVEAVSNATGQSRVIKDGDKLSDQTTIVTSAGSTAILAFSNGATVDVAADTTLNIDKFEQDPFAEDVNMAKIKQEPTTSETRLNLTKGELVGKVVHLNIDRGSEFTVQTPVGAAGIRGTTFQITYTPGPNGSTFFTITTSDGTVVFTGTTVLPVAVPTGKQIVVTFNSSNGVPSAPVVPSDTPPALQAQLQAESQLIAAAVANTTIGGGTGGATGNQGGGAPAGSNNTPSQPLQPPPQTTPTAGSTGS
jgi:hypothetical protein